MRKIAIYQGEAGDFSPSLHLMITESPRYQEGKLCVEDVEQALAKIEAWLRIRMENGGR